MLSQHQLYQILNDIRNRRISAVYVGSSLIVPELIIDDEYYSIVFNLDEVVSVIKNQKNEGKSLLNIKNTLLVFLIYIESRQITQYYLNQISESSIRHLL